MMKQVLSKDQVSEVKNSYGRCLAKGDFIASFYDEFLGSSPEAGEKFKNTDFTEQYKLLRHGINLVIMYSGGDFAGKAGLGRIGDSHSRRGLNIDPKFYVLWKNALLKTVSMYDRKYSADIHKSWSDVIDVGIEFIVSKY